MKRALPWIVLAVMLVCVMLPAAGYFSTPSSASAEEPTRITQYNAVFDIGEDGDMEVTETLIVSFPVADRHGIFRFFDEYDPNEKRARRAPREVSVVLDGRPEQFERYREQSGRFHVVKIGSADRTVTPGLHTYVITYTIEDVLLARGDDSSAFYWNLIPGGWAQAIDQGDLTVNLPVAPSGDVRCAVGAGEGGGCDADVSGRSISVQVADLPRNTPVTVQADLPVAAPSEALLPWRVRWSAVLGSAWWPLALVAALALFTGWLGRRIASSTFEDEPGFPLSYAPPAGIGPAQADYVLRERTTDDAFVGNLMHAAERGAISLDRQEGAWTITPLPAAAEVQLDSATWKATTGLSPTIGQPFVMGAGDPEAGKVLRKAMSATAAETRSWTRREGLLVKAGLGSLAGIAVVAAFFVFALVLVIQPGRLSVLAMVPGAFAAMALPVWYPGASTKRSAEGRRLWSEVGGFRRILSTPSSIDRFDFSGRHELYTAYLPWAVAFGCADEWAQKYRVEVGSEPPSPLYVGGMGAAAGAGVGSITDDFSATMSSAISAYQATQSSSGSSGGGFSGGGGGGGGGGGSW